MRLQEYEWIGFWLHFALGAIITALLGLGLRLTPFGLPRFVLSFLTQDTTVANVVSSAVVFGSRAASFGIASGSRG